MVNCDQLIDQSADSLRALRLQIALGDRSENIEILISIPCAPLNKEPNAWLKQPQTNQSFSITTVASKGAKNHCYRKYHMIMADPA